MQRCVPLALILVTMSCGSPSAPSSSTGQHNNATSVTLAVSSDTASQGDTVKVGISFTQGDIPGDPLYLEFSFDGSPPAIDTLTIPSPGDANDPTPSSLSGYIIIPNASPDGQLTLTAILPDQGDTSTATITIKDVRAPIVAAYIAPGVTPNAFVYDYTAGSNVIDLIAGATDSVVVTGRDNHSVAWLGWSFGPPSNARDSVAVSGAGVRATIPFTVPASLAGSTPVFTAFARDADGNMAVDSFGQVDVAPFVHHPVRTAALGSAPTDIAYDAKRKVLYLSEPGQSHVLVLSITSMTFQTPIAVPVAPAGLDLTPSGDTLVVALSNTGDLAFVTLAGAPATKVVPLKSLDSVANDTTTFTSAARNVRVAADGRVIVGTFRVANGTENGAVVQYDLTTGHDTVVFPSSVVSLARSGDATRVIVAGDISGNLEAILYDGVAHQYTGGPNVGAPQSGNYLSGNQNGTSFLIGNTLFDANLDALGTLSDDNALTTDGYGSAISDSGTTVWLGGPGGGCSTFAGPALCPATQPGFYFRLHVPAKLRDQEGQLIEVGDAPQGLLQLVALGGDSTLIGVGPSQIMAFDLTTSTAGVVSSRVASHTLHPRVRSTVVHAASPLDIRVKLRGKMRSLRITPPAR